LTRKKPQSAKSYHNRTSYQTEADTYIMQPKITNIETNTKYLYGYNKSNKLNNSNKYHKRAKNDSFNVISVSNNN
jgi:hypothetical protein